MAAPFFFKSEAAGLMFVRQRRWQFLFWFPREDAPADHKGDHCGKKNSKL